MSSETIRQLYSGTLVPSERSLPDTFEIATLNAEISDHLNSLLSHLGNEDKAALLELMRIKNTISMCYMEQAFVDGYKTATCLLFEGLSKTEHTE